MTRSLPHPPYQHCHACGAAYGETEGFPRRCEACGTRLWLNPSPVVLLLVPLRLPPRLPLGSELEGDGPRRGLLVMRRAAPHRDPERQGRLALPGGFLEMEERWQEGGAREVFEETGACVEAATVEPFWFTSTTPKPNRVLLFGLAAELDAAQLPPHVPNHECPERGVIFGPEGLEEVFAFDLHVEAARRWLEREGIGGPHRYRVI